MLNLKNKSDCCGCYACESICSKNAIRLFKDSEGFYYPRVDKSKCVNCNLCDKVCPILNEGKTNAIMETFAVYNRNADVRENSSSGGVFSHLADYILGLNGVVFGAAFDDEYNVRHSYIEKIEDLPKLRTSKYVQSSIDDSYIIAKKFLTQGRLVLFTGTPCQIAGLKNYLNKDYSNLYTQDLICHGVPSPDVWQAYLKYINSKDKEIKNISFRSKKTGWKNFGIEITYADGNNYFSDLSMDVYLQVFLKNLCLRPSCYACSFKKKKPYSDITLADYWGVNYINPKIDDDKGISLVLVNSSKGKEMLESNNKKLFIEQIDLETALPHNMSLIEPPVKHRNRDKFIKNFRTKPFDELILKYGKEKKTPIIVSYYRRGKSKLKRMLLK